VTSLALIDGLANRFEAGTLIPHRGRQHPCGP